MAGDTADDPPTAQARTASFAASFRARLLALETALTTSQDVGSIRKELLELRRDLTEAVAFLPSYDQRLYESELTAVEAKLTDRQASRPGEAPKKRFAFKRTAPAGTAPPPSASSYETAERETPRAAPDDLQPERRIAQSNLLVTPSSLAGQNGFAALQDLTLSDYDSSIIDLLVANLRLQALRLHRLRRCVVLSHWIEGSVYVEAWQGGAAVLTSRQARIHSTQDVAFHISTLSHPIIERSSRLVFGDYPSPALLAPTAPSTTTVSAQVQDFDHPVGVSPNWRQATPGENERAAEKVRTYRRRREEVGTGGAGDVGRLLALWS